MIDRGGVVLLLACGSLGAAACVGPTPALGTSDGGASAGGSDTTSNTGGSGAAGGSGGSGASSSVGGGDSGGGMPSLCDGDGQFEAGEICYGAAVTQSGATRNPVLGDLDGEGGPDLLGWAPGVGYHVRLSEESGSFASPMSLPGPLSTIPVRGAIGKLSIDSDGLADLPGDFALSFGQNSTSLGVWTGNGSGSVTPVSPWTPTSSECTLAVVVAELTGDPNKPDIAAVGAGGNACASGGKLRVFDNVSSATAMSFAVVYNHPIEAVATFVRPWDRDGDGDMDLLVTSTPDNQLHVFDNDAGTFSPSSTVISGAQGLYEVAGGDLDGDEDGDVVAGSVNGNDLVVLRNDVAGFTELTLAVGAPQGTVEIHDLDADGDLDIVVGNADRITVYLGDGAGTFQGPLHLFEGLVDDQFALGDLNGDGRADFVSYHAANSQLVVILSDATARSPI